MDVKTQVATKIALKVFDDVKSSEKWDDIFVGEFDWDEFERLMPKYDIDEMIKSLGINQKSIDQMIEELNDKVDHEVEMLQQSGVQS